MAFPCASSGTSPNRKAVRSRFAFAEARFRWDGSDGVEDEGPKTDVDEDVEVGACLDLDLDLGLWEEEEEEDEVSGSSIQANDDWARVERVGMGGCGRWRVWTLAWGATPRGSASIFWLSFSSSAEMVLSLEGGSLFGGGDVVVAVVVGFGVSLRSGESSTIGVFSAMAATALLSGSESTLRSVDLGEVVEEADPSKVSSSSGRARVESSR